MKKELEMVVEFHKKYGSLVSDQPTLIPQDRINLRHFLISEEVSEYKAGAELGDLENIAKELADVLFATYGTIVEHGLQDKMEEIFAEVYRSNMSKDYGEDKPQKGKDFIPADIKKILNN